MSLVKITEFSGSLVANEAMSNIHDTGLMVYIKSFGYDLEINPIMEATPKGMIEDSPNIHTINFVKVLRVLDTESDDNSIIQNNYMNCIKFKPNFRYNTKNDHRVWSDTKSKTRWFEHTHSVEVKRLDGEDNSDYAMRITELVYNLMNNKEAN